MASKKQPTPEQIEKFKGLTAKPVEEQTEFFLKSFIFALDDKWKSVVELQKAFRKYLRDANEGKEDLNPGIGVTITQLTFNQSKLPTFCKKMV